MMLKPNFQKLLSLLAIIVASGLPAGAQSVASPAPQAAVEEQLIVCLAPRADKVRVNKTLKTLQSTVSQTIHISNDNYDVLYVTPAKGKTDATVKGLLALAQKNVTSVEVNTCFSAAQPYHPIAQTILPNGTRLTLTTPRQSGI